VHEKSEEDIQMMRDAIKSCFIFDDLGEDDVKSLIDAFEGKSFKNGEIICRHKEAGDFFYIISLGKVDFYVEEEEIGTAKRGFSFVGLLCSTPATRMVPQGSLRRIPIPFGSGKRRFARCSKLEQNAWIEKRGSCLTQWIFSKM
jgi:hypothetical protein